MPENNITITYQTTSGTHSEINDLIGRPPNWLLRSGISMVAFVTTIILVGSYFFKYPDKLTGPGILTSTTPPIEIISRTNGYIDEIHFQEGSEIQKGDAILYINNTTDLDQLDELIKWIENYERIHDPREFLILQFVEDLQLGTVQSEYANLQLRYNELQQTLKDGLVFQQINNLGREIEKIYSLNKSQQKEKEIYFQELELSKKDFVRNEKLEADGVISSLDLERIKTVLLQKERQYEGMNNNIIQNNIRIEQLELEKLKFQQQRAQTIQNYLFSISEIIARIRSSIENWNKTYTVDAPIGGTLAYNKDIVTKKNLKQGQVIGYILPARKNEQYISALFPSNNIGKVEIGQKVIVKFDAYPFKEFGVAIASVDEISKIPEVNEEGIPNYELRMLMPNLIITDYQDTIIHKPNMTANVEIITEDKSVFTRIFDQFISILKNY